MLLIRNLRALSNKLHSANREILVFITLLWDISMLQQIKKERKSNPITGLDRP
jgi:hypothetical protein